MKNTDTDKKEGVEFNRVDSGKSPGEQPLNEDKEIITNDIIRTRFIITLVLLLIIIIFIIVLSIL
ncbi:MAG: hypothetical protein ACLFPM_02760 [Candidatus Izemoplasmatales bacterium]